MRDRDACAADSRSAPIAAKEAGARALLCRLAMRPRLRFALVASSSLALFATASAAPRDASACSAPCAASRILPGPEGTLPSSAPGLAILAYGAGSDTELGFELRDAQGALVAGALRRDSSKQRYFAPTTPLAPGAYRARLASPCSGAGIEDGLLTSSFTVTAAAPLPTSAGSLSVASAGRESTRATTSAGSCTDAVDAAVVDLSLAASPSIDPYGDAISWETWVDGRFWWAATGRLAATEGSAHGVLRLFAACDGMTPRGRHPGLSEGPHDVELRARLTGHEPPIAPATLRVLVSCGMDNGKVLEPVPPLEPTEPTPPSAPPPSTAPPAATDAGSAPAADPEAQPGSCAFAPLATGSHGPLVASTLLGLALLARSARRRRSR